MLKFIGAMNVYILPNATGNMPIIGLTKNRRLPVRTHISPRIMTAGRLPNGGAGTVLIRTTPFLQSRFPRSAVTVKSCKGKILDDGSVFYDFGQEITALLEIKADGNNGDSVRILCGEEAFVTEEEYYLAHMQSIFPLI